MIGEITTRTQDIYSIEFIDTKNHQIYQLTSSSFTYVYKSGADNLFHGTDNFYWQILLILLIDCRRSNN